VFVAMLAALALVLAACGPDAPAASEPAMVRSPGASAQAPDPPTPEAVEDDDEGAGEVCGEMIRESLPKQLTHGTVQGPPRKLVAGRDTTCTYPIEGGSLRMSVRETATHAEATAYFAQLRRTVGPGRVVPLLGEASFTAADGSTYTLKDEKVLTVDVTKLPKGNDRKQIAQSLSFEILSCWTG
jgi:hypothetical protein